MSTLSQSPPVSPKSEKQPSNLDEDEVPDYQNEPISSFDEMGLDDKVLRGVYNYGFERPSAIQQTGIKPLLDGHDVIAQAQSGTGKTATFSIGMLCNIDNTTDDLQSLMIAPTRELADQIFNVITNLGSYTQTRFVKLIGGESVRNNIHQLQKDRPQPRGRASQDHARALPKATLRTHLPGRSRPVLCSHCRRCSTWDGACRQKATGACRACCSLAPAPSETTRTAQRVLREPIPSRRLRRSGIRKTR